MAGPLVAAINARMPGVRLHLVESSSAKLQEQLYDGRIDMALVLHENAETVGDGQSHDDMVLEPLLGKIPRIGTSDWSAGLLQRESTVQAVMNPSL